jgi:hypothetical protein
MSIVRHEPGVVALRQRRKLVQGRDVAVHRKDAIGRDQGALVSPAQLGQQLARMPDVGVAKGHHGRAREPRAGP